jgi:hypothetical protein
MERDHQRMPRAPTRVSAGSRAHSFCSTSERAGLARQLRFLVPRHQSSEHSQFAAVVRAASIRAVRQRRPGHISDQNVEMKGPREGRPFAEDAFTAADTIAFFRTVDKLTDSEFENRGVRPG